MITTCCDHMGGNKKFVFCDLSRKFPFACQHLCAAFVADQDPTPEREQLWDYHVTGPAQAQAEAAIVEPGRGDAE